MPQPGSSLEILKSAPERGWKPGWSGTKQFDFPGPPVAVTYPVADYFHVPNQLRMG